MTPAPGMIASTITAADAWAAWIPFIALLGTALAASLIHLIAGTCPEAPAPGRGDAAACPDKVEPTPRAELVSQIYVSSATELAVVALADEKADMNTPGRFMDLYDVQVLLAERLRRKVLPVEALAVADALERKRLLEEAPALAGMGFNLHGSWRPGPLGRRLLGGYEHCA